MQISLILARNASIFSLMVLFMNLMTKSQHFCWMYIHCIILPLMIALIPVVGEFSHHWWHTYLEPWEIPTLLLVIFLTGKQVLKNWSPKKKLSLLLLGVGTVFVVVGNQGFNPHSFFHPFFTVLGISFLLFAQFKAHKLNHLVTCQHSGH